MKRYVYIAGAILLLGLIAWGLRPQPITVDFGRVAAGPMQVTVDEEGKTRIKERYVVLAPLAGQMRRVELKPGDPVTRGSTLLTTIEPSDPALLDARAVASAQAHVNSAKALKLQTGQLLEKARVALDFAESEYRRMKASFESRVASEQSFTEAAMLERTRKLELKAATFAEQIAKFELEQAEAALMQISPGTTGANEPSKLTVPSPISGVVLGVKRESAGMVQAGMELVEIGDPTDLEVVVQVLSRDAVAIQPGSEATLEQWGGEKPLRAMVRRVEPSGFTKISALGVEEQRVNVLLDFLEPFEQRKSLGDGFRVEARIVVWKQEHVVKVPAGALFRQHEEWCVFVVENGSAKLRTIKVGRINALEAEALEGLKEGDRVIMHPGDKVMDGKKVLERK